MEGYGRKAVRPAAHWQDADAQTSQGRQLGAKEDCGGSALASGGLKYGGAGTAGVIMGGAQGAGTADLRRKGQKRVKRGIEL